MTYYDHIKDGAIASKQQAQNSKYIKNLLGTGNTELLTPAQIEAAGLYVRVRPALLAGQTYTGAVVITDPIGTADEVRELTVLEVQTALDLRINATVHSIDEAAKNHAEHRLQPVGMILVDRMLRYDPPNAKAISVDAWVHSIYVESEYRKALAYADVLPLDGTELDFTSFGEKPYTVAQLMQEYV